MGQTCLKGDDAVEKRPTRSSGKYEDHATPKESKHNRSVDHSRVTGVSLVSQIESLQHTMRPSVLVVGESHLHPSFRQFTPLFRPGLSALSVASCEALQLTGQILAVGEDCSIAMTNYETGHVLRRWVHAHERDITCVTRPLAGTRRFATAGRDTVVKVWTVDSDAPLAELCGHTLNVPSVDLLPDGLHAVSGSRDNTVRLWDVETASELCCADIKLNLVRFVRYVPSLQCVAQGGEDMMLRLWDIRCDGGSSAMELPRELPCADYFPVCGDVSEKHPHQFITGHNGVNGTGSFAAEWDLRMGKQVRTYVGHSSTINSVCTTSNTKFYPGGTFITASEDGNINVWESPDDVTSPSQIHPRNVYDLPEGYVTCLETVANGDIIASMRNGCITVLRPQISEKSGETKIAQRFRYIGDPAGRKAGPAAML